MGKPNSLAALAAKGKKSAEIAATHFRITPSTKLLALMCLVGVVLLSLAAALDAHNVNVPGNGLRWLYLTGAVGVGMTLWSVLVEMVYTWLELRYFLWLVMLPSAQLMFKVWLNTLAGYVAFMELFQKTTVGGVPPQPLSTAESWVHRLLTCCLLFVHVCVLVTVASNLTITILYSEGSRQKIAAAMQHAYVMYRLIRDKLVDEYKQAAKAGGRGIGGASGGGGGASGGGGAAMVAPVTASAMSTAASSASALVNGGHWRGVPADGSDGRPSRPSQGEPSVASGSLSPFVMRQRTRRRRTWRVRGILKDSHAHLYTAHSHPPMHMLQQQPPLQHLPQSVSLPHPTAQQQQQQQQKASLPPQQVHNQQQQQPQQLLLMDSQSQRGERGDGRAVEGPRLRRSSCRVGSSVEGLAAGPRSAHGHNGVAATAAEPAAAASPPPLDLTGAPPKPGSAAISIHAVTPFSEGRGSVTMAADAAAGAAAAAPGAGAGPVPAAAAALPPAAGHTVSFSAVSFGTKPLGKAVGAAVDPDRKAGNPVPDSESASESSGEGDLERDAPAAESVSVSVIADRYMRDTELVHVRRTLLASLEIIDWLQERNEGQVRGAAGAPRPGFVTSHSIVRRELHAMRQYGVRQIVSPRALLDEMLMVYSRLSDSDIPLLARHFADAVWECAAPDGDTLRPEDFAHIFSRDDDRQIAWDALDGDKDGILTRGDVAASVATFLQHERSMALTVTAVRRLTRSLQISLIGIINGIFLMAAYLSILDLTHFLTGGNSSKTSLDIFSVYVLVVSLIFSEQIKQVLSGCMLILSQQPFDIGEELVIEEAPNWRVMGIVQDFNLFFLRVKKSTDGELVTLPLNKLSTARFTNLTRSDWKIEQNYLAVDASTPPSVLAAITDAALAVIRATPGEYDVAYGFLAVYHGFDRPNKVVIRTFHRYKFNLAAPHKRIAQARHGVMAAVRQTLDKLGVEFTELRMHAPLPAGSLPYPPGATAAADAAAAAAAAGYGIPPVASAPPDAATPAELDLINSNMRIRGDALGGGLGSSWVPHRK